MKLTDTLRFSLFFCTATLPFISWLSKSSGRRWRHDKVLAVIAKHTDLQRVNTKNHQVQPIKAIRFQREAAASTSSWAACCPKHLTASVTTLRSHSFPMKVCCSDFPATSAQFLSAGRLGAHATLKKSLGRAIQQLRPVQDGYGWSELAV